MCHCRGVAGFTNKWSCSGVAMAVCKSVSVITGQMISLLKDCRELISTVVAGGPGDQNSVQLFCFKS